MRRTFFLPLLAAAGLVLFALALPCRAQTSDERAQTEQRLEELRAQIKQTEAQLTQTEAAEQSSLKKLESIERQLKVRKELIDSYQLRLRHLNEETDSIRTSIRGLQRGLRTLKTQYQNRAAHAYMYGRMHDLALVLAARSINEMLVRVQYLRRFTDQRRQKLEAIRTAAQTLQERQSEMQQARAKTQLLIQEAEQQRTDLADLQRTRTQIINDLRAQRKNLESDLNRKREAANEMERRIQALIASARQRDRAGDAPVDMAAFNALSGSFRENRGRLPWPARGVVTEPYGEIVNPVHGTTTTNPGILISTQPSVQVHAVFAGEVIGVDAMPEFGTYIVIRHGPQYQSLYSNFSMVYVQPGDQVTAGQILGRAGTNAEPKGPGIFFGLFEQGSELNPTAWLQRR